VIVAVDADDARGGPLDQAEDDGDEGGRDKQAVVGDASQRIERREVDRP
jgi:hypothetical protein